MSAAFLSSISSTMRRARSRAARHRRRWGLGGGGRDASSAGRRGAARRGGPSPRRRRPVVGRGVSHDRIFLQGSVYSRMVAIDSATAPERGSAPTRRRRRGGGWRTPTCRASARRYHHAVFAPGKPVRDRSDPTADGRRVVPRRSGRGRAPEPARARSRSRRTIDRQDDRQVAAPTGGPLGRAQDGQRVDHVRRPLPVDLDPARLEARLAGDPGRTRRGGLSAGLTRGPVCGAARRWGRTSTRSRPSGSRAASATARWATWNGSKVPPNTTDHRERGRAGSRSLPLPRLRLPFELRPRRSGRDRRRRPRRAAARRRCRAVRGRAGTARPIPRRRSWSGRRSARSACRAPGRRRRPRARR